MSANNLITATVFSAFLKCPTKAHLLLVGQPHSETFFTDTEARISSMFKAAALRVLRRDQGLLEEALDCGQLEYGSDLKTRATLCRL